MEVCRLCLDLLSNSNFISLDGDYKDMVEVLAPELNLEISDASVICTGCISNIDELFPFKSRCFNNEEQLRDKISYYDIGGFSVKEILEGTGKSRDIILGNEKVKERMCRICLDPVDSDSYMVLKSNENNDYLNNMLNVCFPEMDLNLTRDPVICEKCLESVQKLHHCHSLYVSVEDKLRDYCETHGTNSSNQINLHSVLQSDIIKCENEENKSDIKTEPDVEIKDATIKQEEVNIKCEVENSSNDNIQVQNSIHFDELEEEDLADPMKAKKMWRLAVRTIEKQKRTIKCLRNTNYRLKKRIKFLENAILHLKTSRDISEHSFSVLQI